MPTNNRRLGVYGVNLPNRGSTAIQPADFSIGGLIGVFERSYDQAFPCRNMTELQSIFGGDFSSSYYGNESASLFFNNAAPANATLYVKAHVGNTGSAIDAVQASSNAVDQALSPQTTLTIKSGYQGITEYGTHGNRVGYTITNGARFTTSIKTQGTAQDTYVYCTSVSNIKVGDIIKVAATGQTAGSIYKKVTAIDESTGKVSFATAVYLGTTSRHTGTATSTSAGHLVDSAADFTSEGVTTADVVTNNTSSTSTTVTTKNSATDLTVGADIFTSGNSYTIYPGTYSKVADVVTVLGFKINTYEKTLTGIVNEVDVNLGKLWCTMEPEVSDYYVNNVFASSSYLIVKDASVSETNIQDTYPATVATVTYLTAGAAGTAPTTLAHWQYHNETAFDALPVRFISNCETTLATVHASLETYSKARWDNPKILPVVAADQTKAQLETIGAGYQRSDDVLMVVVAQWVQIPDPFATSATAPLRSIPNVGAVMGTWIRSIATLGIHYIPSTTAVPLRGISGILGTQFTNDLDRTDLLNYGVNCIDFRSGIGYTVRNFCTPSTTTVYQFANGILMRSFFHVSFAAALIDSENTPNSMGRVRSDKNKCDFFMRRMWERGSTGNVPEGETFGQLENADGSLTKYEDSVFMEADIVNNPADALARGERNIDGWFKYPAPAQSIAIGLGFII